MGFLLLFSLISLTTAAAQFKYLKEWNMWKVEHSKNYQSEREEVEKHLVWLSNKAYIDTHNANADIFGFTLMMNSIS